jgi:hypothetical protein
MGKVIVYRPPVTQMRGRVEKAEASQARILMFTGVRYQRGDVDQAPSSGDPGLVTPGSGGAGGGRRRKRG